MADVTINYTSQLEANNPPAGQCIMYAHMHGCTEMEVEPLQADKIVNVCDGGESLIIFKREADVKQSSKVNYCCLRQTTNDSQ